MRRTRLIAALSYVLFTAACATQPDAPSHDVAAHDPEPIAMLPGEPEASAGPATLVVSLDEGTVLWFERTVRQERRIGSSDERYVTEVVTLWNLDVTKTSEKGVHATLHFQRIRGHVVDGDRLDFDTRGEVPEVFCRLDEVKPDLALEGVEVRFILKPDGKLRLISTKGPDGMPAMAAIVPALRNALSMLGEVVRRGEPLTAGDSWTSAPGVTMRGAAVAAEIETTVTSVSDDAVALRARGGATATAGDDFEGGRSGPGPGSQLGTSEWTAALSVSRHDGLVVRSDQVQRNGIGNDSDVTMENRVRITLRRVRAPASAE